MLDIMDLFRTQQNPMVRYQLQGMEQAQSQPVDQNADYLTQLQQAGADQYAQPVSSPVMQMAAAQQAPAASDYTPTTGAQMEADSRNSIDGILAHMTSQRAADRQNDRNIQWMTFFSKLASSKNPRLLGGLGEGAEALTDVTGKQAQSNKLLDQSALEDQLKVAEWNREQTRQEAAQRSTEAYQKGELGLKAKELELGKYQPVKDVFGNVTGIFDARTGKMVPMANANSSGSGDTSAIGMEPSSDPQQAAQQILGEQGTPYTPVATRQDVTGRNQQAKAYRDAANGAKSAIQQLDQIDAQTGKYTPGKVANFGYGTESALGMGGKEASARAEADKASKNLANAFMAQNVGAKGAGIRMVEFDAGAVPNADMPDEARTNLIKVNKAIANSQIQRAAISDMYPRLHLSNVNTIMDAYEQNNPPILPIKNEHGDPLPNPNWMAYKDWLKAGRPNTAEMAMKSSGGESTGKSGGAAPEGTVIHDGKGNALTKRNGKWVP